METTPDRATDGCRLVLLSGPSGSGKTTLCRSGHAVMVSAWGSPAAAVDVDRLYANVDPLWELPYDPARNALMLRQAGGLARSLFENGWPIVLVCGNSLFEPADTATLLAAVAGLPVTAHHVTLLPDRDEVLRRCAADPARRPDGLLADHDLHRARLHPGSAVLATTGQSPREALDRLVALVGSGTGRIG